MIERLPVLGDLLIAHERDVPDPAPPGWTHIPAHGVWWHWVTGTAEMLPSFDVYVVPPPVPRYYDLHDPADREAVERLSWEL